MTVFYALNYDNVVFRGYITWCSLLIIKMVLMSLLTAFQRVRKGVSKTIFHPSADDSTLTALQAVDNPEDAAINKAEIKKDEAVERVRRAHLNDLENIPAFLIVALFYVMTEPQPDVALWLIRIAVIARILHTIVSY